LEEIRNDGFQIGARASDERAIEELNEVLRLPWFSDMVIKKRPSVVQTEYIRKLISDSEQYRKKTFSELTVDQKKLIKKLNRMVMETVYAKTCPKVFKEPDNGSPVPPQSHTPAALLP
jgi:DNA-binding NtrC family response regulator